MDTQQALFSATLMSLLAQGLTVYDGALPPDGTPYPFVYLGESFGNDLIYKNGSRSEVTQTVHVYHNNLKTRGTFSNALRKVKQCFYSLEASGQITLTSLSQQVLPDDTTDQPLLHGIVEATFLFK